MARREIIEYPDPRLRRTSALVERFDADLAQLGADLIDTLRATGGLALCAPQLDDLRRVIVIDTSGGVSPQVYVNPVIESTSVPAIVEESCLSLPGIVGYTIRKTKARVRAQDVTGREIVRDLEGMEAVCFQHEVDHLEGKLFVDRLSLFQRIKYRVGELRARKRFAA